MAVKTWYHSSRTVSGQTTSIASHSSFKRMTYLRQTFTLHNRPRSWYTGVEKHDPTIFISNCQKIRFHCDTMQWQQCNDRLLLQSVQYVVHRYSLILQWAQGWLMLGPSRRKPLRFPSWSLIERLMFWRLLRRGIAVLMTWVYALCSEISCNVK